MPKKDKKSKKDKKQAGSADAATAGAVEAVEAVRSAVERTFAATAESAQQLAGPAQQFAGEVAVAANRIREVLEDAVGGDGDLAREVLRGTAQLLRTLGGRGERALDGGADGRRGVLLAGLLVLVLLVLFRHGRAIVA